MKPEIEIRMEERETLGQKSRVYIAECEGLLYEFNPLQAAVEVYNKHV